MRDKVLFLIWVFAFVFVPRLSFAAEIINYNFNTQSFGILSHGSYWTMQPSGGVDNSPAVRLEYSVAGTSDKAPTQSTGQSAGHGEWAARLGVGYSI